MAITRTVKGNLVDMALYAMQENHRVWFGHGANCKKAMASGCFQDTPERMYIPLIGCGIGGLQWEPTKAIIDAAAPDLPITVVEFSGEE